MSYKSFPTALNLGVNTTRCSEQQRAPPSERRPRAGRHTGRAVPVPAPAAILWCPPGASDGTFSPRAPPKAKPRALWLSRRGSAGAAGRLHLKDPKLLERLWGTAALCQHPKSLMWTDMRYAWNLLEAPQVTEPPPMVVCVCFEMDRYQHHLRLQDFRILKSQTRYTTPIPKNNGHAAPDWEKHQP